jgi:chromosome segregation ATPase
MRTKIKKSTVSDFTTIESELKFAINRLTDQINIKQTELDKKKDDIAKLETKARKIEQEYEEYNQKIVNLRIEQDKQKVKLLGDVEEYKKDAELKILQREKKLILDNEKKANEMLEQKDKLIKREKEVQAEEARIANANANVAIKLSGLTALEIDIKDRKERLVKREQELERKNALLSEAININAEAEKNIVSAREKLDKMYEDYNIKQKTFAEERNSFIKVKSDILSENNSLKEKLDWINRKETDLISRENAIKIKECVLNMQENDLKKLKKDLDVIQRRVLNVNG